MVSFLALLPRSVTTFLYADSGSPEILWQAQHPPHPIHPPYLTILQYSFLAFVLGTASLLVNFGLEWNAEH